ncbi:6-phosphogluconolactonase [Pararhizobium mangrovi]|uniref:6-phosphogluconolactonase n=1 Tax=Pararhizobium mangrovi TaxID=2590452 RepID=A0A506U5Q4_9HYPH|nr:6-phosphogluconolactonase [Pararhizobium mangrovi]TPW27909.1 6-phosphogluconolactonase [Pararhizobium mangrovi]
MTESKARPITLQEFDDRAALAEALAERICETLERAIAEKGEAVMAVSGGSTPKLLFEALSKRNPGWVNVTVSLVDERFVPPEDERSNQRLVSTYLLKDAAAEATFVPLYQHVDDVDAAAALASGKIDTLALPFDVAILGMGTDGHTASFFPGGDNLEAATDPGERRSVLAMHAGGAEEPRLTLTLPQLVASTMLVLHIEGGNKREALDRAREPGPASEMPIRSILDAVERPLEVYWAA